ncbi:MAG: DDE-type integrase/transposase/recombinase, partial [Gemmatimonadaceae bacterium]
MVSPALRRELVRWVREADQLSERRACRATGVARSTIQYQSRRPSQEPLRRRLRDLAGTRGSYGYKRLHILLRREGWAVNHKRVYRLYGEEGLALKRRRPKRRKSAATRAVRPVTTAPNERWAMDFVHDTLAGGGSIRILSVLDTHTRECVALVAAHTFRGEDVARVLSEMGDERGLPSVIQVDNGAEFTSRAL